ncbi:bifunctional hydroxymethylpyrimidine kinase/phosphomethylpyrimidine kinase [Tissierella sp.]|uniref:bifunctional hydroxymethylpyrimidine kinase/phosphomethylpyrimidine kinase n=1 Tax=Tissierella sp. TaxID=41274 RepID=UPI0028ADD0C6|nr:bifunctional hydroxymethylpyrimidine kinase/phosphomethylpyrimidine kinase [Tissierella sp.]
MKKLLTIAGSDSCGGAGIQADLKTFSAHRVYGMSVITAVTAQNSQGVFAVQDISVDIIQKQIEVIFDDIFVDATKIGMVSKTETIKTIADTLNKYKINNLVVDPVMVSKSGFHLLQPDAKEALINHLFPITTVVTPNIPEAEVITGLEIQNLNDVEKAAKIIYKMGPRYVLVKGGHMEGEALDILYDGQKFTHYNSPRINRKNTHGTGCTLSSAIASNLGKGLSVTESIAKAKAYITLAIENSFPIGKGVGPVHHFYELYK